MNGSGAKAREMARWERTGCEDLRRVEAPAPTEGKLEVAVCASVPSVGVQKQVDPGSSSAMQPSQNVELPDHWETLCQVNKAKNKEQKG